MNTATSGKARGKIPERIKTILWAAAAGRCEYENCNAPLLGDLISGKAQLNKAYIAHIVAAEPDGPRGDPIRSPMLAKKVENLMLMCDPHHRLIDREDVPGHPESRLLAMKAAHESRIEALTALSRDRSSHVLLYAARIGEHNCPVSFEAAKTALMNQGRYSAESQPLALDVVGCPYQSNEPDYWKFQIDALRTQFQAVVRERIARGSVSHLSVFALAPQPLLIELGRLLSDIRACDVYQLHREPPGWSWAKDDGLDVRCSSSELAAHNGCVALKLALSATVSDGRIHAALGEAVPIWSITAETPHNDVLQSPEDLSRLRAALRRTFDRIKAQYGEHVEIHLFPAAPVSAAVEVGRVWMPRSDLALEIYDNDRAHGGFIARTRLDAATSPSTPTGA
ncbi:MAG: hypothetical protein C0434_12070 [Xanthomonadaceae bacterium]|nr:hypothetical protein [Xanthomonadaceae bacterium]